LVQGEEVVDPHPGKNRTKCHTRKPGMPSSSAPKYGGKKEQSKGSWEDE
jgi:hypothetical protein